MKKTKYNSSCAIWCVAYLTQIQEPINIIETFWLCFYFNLIFFIFFFYLANCVTVIDSCEKKYRIISIRMCVAFINALTFGAIPKCAKTTHNEVKLNEFVRFTDD